MQQNQVPGVVAPVIGLLLGAHFCKSFFSKSYQGRCCVNTSHFYLFESECKVLIKPLRCLSVTPPHVLLHSLQMIMPTLVSPSHTWKNFTNFALLDISCHSEQFQIWQKKNHQKVFFSLDSFLVFEQK